MKKQDISLLGKEDAFQLIGKEWMLITAGDSTSYNTMTASWGGLGWLWNKPVAFIFVRPERYTHDFIEKNDRLSLSFFSEDYKPALQICGTKSGRDGDKVKEAGLSPKSLESGVMTFDEARMVLDCKKLFKTEMTDSAFIDKELLARWYNEKPGGGLHTIYVVEIESVYAK
ncbi:MAG: flavin reductase family protein [Paludibacteraceae bacterium]|nr:flavin reductase family protein [Paludibacteraceae bacterium]